MSPAVARLIPRVAPINPRAHKDVQLAQDGLERGMADAINALASVSTFPLTRTQITGVLVLSYGTCVAVWTLCEAHTRRPQLDPCRERPSSLPPMRQEPIE